VTLACVICVVFVTHVYETVYLIQQRESDLVAVERLERARAQAELESIKAQVTPHFLFNSLNTLGWLIEHSPARAVEFNQNLAEVYRYILVPGRRELIPLEEEWEFVLRYFRLLELRFGESVQMEAEDPGDRGSRWFVPPISVQPLVENAVKHNEHSPRHPLRIEIRLEGTRVVVGNDKRARLTGSAAAGTGLANLDERCRLVLGEGIEVIDTGARFTVRVPARVI
jgi:LytS/YehU family sensor histidine kinase